VLAIVVRSEIDVTPAELEGKIGVQRSEFGKGGLPAIYNFSDMNL
jgi:hypothetical protein